MDAEMLLHLIAADLDRPSLYMGGPSPASKRKAADVMRRIEPVLTERDEARAEVERLWQNEATLLSEVRAAENDAAWWKAEAERLREDMKHALMVADETASMQCECDGYYRCGSCPTRIANRAEDVAEILKRSLDNDWGSALSAGGGTDA